jgi:hypothetical protein
LLPAAAPAFLGRLEDQHGRAGKTAGLRKVFRGTEQHRGVPVVAAGVHLAGRGRAVGKVRPLRDRQGVHVGPQSDHPGPCPGRLAPANDADDAGPADARHHLVAPEGFQLFDNACCGAVNIEQQFRVSVEIAAPSRDLRVQAGNPLKHWHRPTP